MQTTIGLIGAGNMGTAIIRGLISSGMVTPTQIYLYDRNPPKLAHLQQTLGIHICDEMSTLVEQCERIFIAVKPHAVLALLASIKPVMTSNKVLISVAAGVTLQAMEAVMGKTCKLVRVMPNTPAMVNAAMSSVTPNVAITDEESEEILQLLTSIGRAHIVPESLIHAVVGVSGSAPAYIFMLIEAMADAAVAAGMSRRLAYEFAAQTVMGSAKMVLDTQQHPGELKDAVCSPGGTTIEAVIKLEEKGFKAAITSAMRACIEKSIKMSE